MGKYLIYWHYSFLEWADILLSKYQSITHIIWIAEADICKYYSHILSVMSKLFEHFE